MPPPSATSPDGIEALLLRRALRLEALSSLSFFARRVLGLRRLSRERLDSLQDTPLEASSRIEAEVLRLWQDAVRCESGLSHLPLPKSVTFFLPCTCRSVAA